jgi:uncharacterized membrane protein
MPHSVVWRGVLIIILCLVLITPARADGFQKLGDEIVIGIVVVSAAIAVLVVVLIVHHNGKKATITGCVNSAANGMSMTDEKDKHTYALSGDLIGVKAGDRMTLEGKRRKENGTTFVFEAHRVTHDLGGCQP